MQDLKELNNRLAKYVDQGLYPGFQWQINIGDKEFSGKYGFNNIHTKQPVLDNTVYRIWSMTKPIVAVVALKLIEQNKLSFDDTIIKSLGLLSVKKIFIGSILGLVLVYFIRFYSLAFNGIKSGYEKINIAVDESAYLLGYSKRKTFIDIHVPFLRNSLLFIIILISLEIIRELPITLILRPFNFETFATTAYISASEDLLEAAAVPSLFLILIASIFIIIASKYILRETNE